jgi:hypothetical protein
MMFHGGLMEETIAGTNSNISAVVVHSYEDLCDAVKAHPEEIVVLRDHAPPTAERIRYCAVGLGGILEIHGFDSVWSVRYDARATTSSPHSLRALAMHTDGSFLEHPPTRFLLGCVRHDRRGGGINTFVPLDYLLGFSPIWVTDALLNADLRFLQTYDGDLRGSLIAHALWRSSDGRLRIRWRSELLPQVVRANGTRAEDAILWLQQFLQSTKPLHYAAKAGETLGLPN